MTDGDGYQSFVQYNFDFGAKTRVQGPPPGTPGQYSNGIVQTFSYDEAVRVKRVTTVNTGAYVHYDYGPNHTSSFASINSVAPNYWESDTFTTQFFDGLGRVFAVASNHPGSLGGNKGQYIRYDVMGRAVQQTNPFEMDSGWNPTGDDLTGYQFNVANTFDWKGRPLHVYHTDGSYQTFEYAGCGCAGGEVVTITDEMTRRQKIYADVLGRQWKTEVLNWDGTVYSTIETTLNARDQATLARQFQGTNQSGVYQDTVLDYDGYGRLWKKHVPEQDTGTATVYSYNSDDTIQSVTDARGASATYIYNNNRHLANEIHYSAPSGITPTSNVTFGYDAAGNRISMTDGLGSTAYVYDSLSRITSETRTFLGLSSSSFTLAYGYNFANQPTSVTDQHSSVSFSTAYDNAGRVNSVNGVGYNSTSTQFVSSATYRAWGALKSSAYGNSTSVTLGYNSRGLITSYSGGGSGASYQYYADGRIKLAQDQSTNSEPIKDRAFSYDHAGRLQEAYSGSEARNFINNTSYAADGPFRQIYSYDVWSNMTNQNWRFWSRNGATTATYNSSNRNTVWSYDADGNLLGRGDGAVYGYDAAGNEISQNQETSYYDSENNGTVGLFFLNTEGHDGDGQLVHYIKKMDHNFNGSTPPWNTSTEDVFKLCSTVLGGRVISEYTGSGTWIVSYVYLGSQRIGEQTVMSGSASSGWRYVDPITGDEGNAVLDPQGVDVGHQDPFPANGSGDPDLQPNGSEPFKGATRMLPIEGGGTKCVLDGITMDCSFIKGEISVQGPDNDCKPKTIVGSDGKLHLAPVGFDPDNGRLGNYYWDNGFSRKQPADDSDTIRINNRGKYVWKYADYARGYVWLQSFPSRRPRISDEDIARVRKILVSGLVGTCKDFIQRTLDAIPGGVYSNNLLTVFDAIDSHGGFTSAANDKDYNAVASGGGSIEHWTAGVVIKNVATISFRDLVEELTHANSPLGTPRFPHPYIPHEVMAKAAVNAAGSLGIDLDRHRMQFEGGNTKLGDPTNKAGDFRNSALFRHILVIGGCPQ